MKIPDLGQFFSAALLLLVFSPVGFGQVAQVNPELCGKRKNTVQDVPGNVRLTASGGGTELEIRRANNLATELHISSLETVKQICAVAGNTLVVFSVFDDDFTYDIRVVKEDTGHVTEIDAFDPVISPNGRWMAFRLFRPRILDSTFSEEYGLYELSKTQGWRVMYPEVLGHAQFHNFGVPEEQVHEFRAASFFGLQTAAQFCSPTVLTGDFRSFGFGSRETVRLSRMSTQYPSLRYAAATILAKYRL